MGGRAPPLDPGGHRRDRGSMGTGILTIDLDALAANWRALDRLSQGETGAVVKADGYGWRRGAGGRWRLARRGRAPFLRSPPPKRAPRCAGPWAKAPRSTSLGPHGKRHRPDPRPTP